MKNNKNTFALLIGIGLAVSFGVALENWLLGMALGIGVFFAFSDTDCAEKKTSSK